MKYNWIEAKAISNGRRVKVRQGEPGGRLWIDMDGMTYNFCDLDFTINFARMRRNAQNRGLNSHVDGLWVSGDTIFLQRANPSEAERFINSLGTLGYDTQELMAEYKEKGKITL